MVDSEEQKQSYDQKNKKKQKFSLQEGMKVCAAYAKEIKDLLKQHKIQSITHNPINQNGFVVFPLNNEAQSSMIKQIYQGEFEIIKEQFPIKNSYQQVNINDLLKEHLNEEQLKQIPKTQEVVGDILILQIPHELTNYQCLIANSYLELNYPKIKTVVKKGEEHSGQYRTRTVEVLAGENKKETIHYENLIKIKINLEKTFFSARMTRERMRITQQIQPQEDVLVMFSGSGVFPITIYKHKQPNFILGIELNPDAYNYSLENLQLNKIKTEKVQILNGDVNVILPSYQRSFDRILMPLPKGAEEFLEISLKKIKQNGFIHIYRCFLHENQIDNYSNQLIQKCNSFGFNANIVNHSKCGQFAPQTYRVCFDIQIL